MNLTNTQKILNQKYANRDFDSYAVFVYKNSDEAFVHSDNVNCDTYFDIASMGKVLVTSTLILKAIDENKLSLNSALKEFFAPVGENVKDITVGQLLTHSSGILRYLISPAAAAAGNDMIAADILKNPLGFAPGSDVVYSCSGMILLGLIAEKIYNMTLEDAFNKYIKLPLGYTRSKFKIKINEENAANCYRWKTFGNLSHPFDDEIVQILGTSAGSGGQFFTLGDIKKFANAVLNKSPLLYSGKMFDTAEKNYTQKISTQGRGLGWLYVNENYNQTGKLFPIGSFGHCGHTGTSMFFSRKENMYVIILTNATRFANMKNNFNGYDYSKTTCKMREDIHNAIYADLSEQGMIG